MTHDEMMKILESWINCDSDHCDNCDLFKFADCEDEAAKATKMAYEILRQRKEEPKPKPIQWNELDQYLGKPVFDRKSGDWYILNGYKAAMKERMVFFDGNYDGRFERFDLYPVEVPSEE